ncbi:MAG TPA: PIG-L family deacetylase [Bacteroidia bacterium]|nr:PIG-L family deacetylase [Bacteroidia bacterium]
MRNIWKALPVTLLMVTGIFYANAQKTPQKNWSSSRILLELEKMKHVGRVLYIAAHPDDENVELISYLENVKGIETTYLSLTRGDGGQDLLGPEVREELGIIRSQELLMARTVDGGHQLFSRANDFGFSKTAAETFKIWNRDDVLADIVWAIRKLKPDVIITRFSPTYTKTHGHHQASAILAQEAFTAAADSTRYPEQLKYVSTWQAQSIFWNTSYWFFRDKKFDTTGLYYTEVGTYIPLIGKSVNELAAEAESMHKSQGNGSSPEREERKEYFTYYQGKKPLGKDIFTDSYDNWSKIKGCENVPVMLDEIIKNFQPQDPSGSLARIAELYSLLEKHQDNYLAADKLKQLQKIILQCAGLYVEAISAKEFAAVGDSLKVSLNIASQNPSVKETLESSLLINHNKLCSFAFDSGQTTYSTITAKAIIPDSTKISGPYWLEEEPGVGMYKVKSQYLRGLPQNPTQVETRIKIVVSPRSSSSKTTNQHNKNSNTVNSDYQFSFDLDIPVFYKNIDPVKGEQYSLVRIVPPAVANPQEKLLVFNNGVAKDLSVKVKSFTKGKATIKLNAPTGWIITPPSTDIDMQGNGAEHLLKFSVTPPANAQSSYINIKIESSGRTYNRSSELISYDHIPEQLLLPKSKVKAERMDIITYHRTIGYIDGAGDEIPAILKQLGYTVDMIPAAQLATIDLKKYDVIIAGIRAYNTVNELKYNNSRLMDYVKNGGNYIVQYNKNFDLVTDNIGPYMLHPSNTRTTEEDSKVTFLHKDSPALNTPNKITDADFDGWVQERGLYYPDKWDTTQYTPILEMADGGEKPVDGSLLVTKYGKGYFTYTGLSFFRQLPAGIPGAFRLFTNLIELGRVEVKGSSDKIK